MGSPFNWFGPEGDSEESLRVLKQEEEEERGENGTVVENVTEKPSDFDAVSKAEKMEKLRTLLEKSALYSHFLAEKLNIPSEISDALELCGDEKKAKEEAASQKADETEVALGFTQSALITGGTLRKYQLQGVAWMVGLYENGLNGILADEMGLGKTLQTISLLAHLYENGVNGPYLVVGPLSTINNWAKEFERFTPTLPVVLYHGSKPERQIMRKNKLLGPVGQWRVTSGHRHRGKTAEGDDIPYVRPEAYPVVITSYEVIMMDRKVLQNHDWKYIVVDEGHRIKNLECKLIKELKKYQSANRLLLTGTPLQNNLMELWSLLNFLLPDIFDDLSTFQRWFEFTERVGNDTFLPQEEQGQIVEKLHHILRPFLLRRLKTDVELSIPERKQMIVSTDPTPEQVQIFHCIRNHSIRNLITQKVETSNFRRTGGSIGGMPIMQFRKACNHPYLFWHPVKDGEDLVDELHISQSGKLLLLDRILSFLSTTDHKVLIFSQMATVLDILADVLEMRDWKYCRIDGSTKASDRESQIEDFFQDPELFVFLLSTRAGGLGINLTAADVVIFFDSDWNPQMDRQAQDRCHRIGQKKQVFVYRLATGGKQSVEVRILEKAYGKEQLGNVVIEKGKFSSLTSIAPSARQSHRLSLQDLEGMFTQSTCGEDTDSVHNPSDAELLGWFPEYKDTAWKYPYECKASTKALPVLEHEDRHRVSGKRSTGDVVYLEPGIDDEDILEEDEVQLIARRKRKRSTSSAEKIDRIAENQGKENSVPPKKIKKKPPKWW